MTIFTETLRTALDASTDDVARAATLPPELYTSTEAFGFEREAIFMQEWLAVGRAERIPEAGDWFTVDLLGEPIVVVRTKSGAISAMSAVCQHRAMQICEGEGNSSTFKCPYHHWIYAEDGRLLGAPAMERTEEFVKADWGLPPLAVEEWLGFIFVNFDVDAEPLAPTLSRYTPYLENYHLADAVCPGTFTLEAMPWNWKVMFENFNDGYHANRLHEYVQDFCPSHLSAFPEPWTDDANVVFRTAGYTHLDGGFNATHRVIMDVFPDLTEEERGRSTFAWCRRCCVSGRRRTSAFSSWYARPVPKRSMSKSVTSSTRPRSRIRCSRPSSPSATPGCRSSSNRIRMQRRRCSEVCGHGLRPGAPAIRGKKKAMCSSTGGWLVAIATRGREGSPEIRACGSWGNESEEETVMRVPRSRDQKALRFRSGIHHRQVTKEQSVGKAHDLQSAPMV